MQMETRIWTIGYVKKPQERTRGWRREGQEGLRFLAPLGKSFLQSFKLLARRNCRAPPEVVYVPFKLVYIAQDECAVRDRQEQVSDAVGMS